MDEIKTVGIVDLRPKLKYMVNRYDLENLTKLYYYLAEHVAKCPASIETAAQSFKDGVPKWCSTTNPEAGSAGKRFLDAVKKFHKSRDVATYSENSFINESLEHFVSCIEEAGIDNIENQILLIRSAMTKKMPSIEKGVEEGSLDQILCYLVPDSAVIWENLSKAPEYRQYLECYFALEYFLNGETWEHFINEAKPDGIVVLGAGSHTKDTLIIEKTRSLSHHISRLNFALIDFSPYMLEYTAIKIKKWLIENKIINHVNFEALSKDFLSLSGWKYMRRDNIPVAWFMNGGTIGNIDEESFFDSINNVSAKGDLFVVSFEAIPPDVAQNESQRKEYKKNVESKYQQDAFKKFIRAPLQGVWPYLKGYSDINHALEKLDINVLDGAEDKLCKVKNSMSMVCSIKENANNKNSRNITLLTSSRYDEQSFIQMAESNEFKYVSSTPSPINENYRVLAFKRY